MSSESQPEVFCLSGRGLGTIPPAGKFLYQKEVSQRLHVNGTPFRSNEPADHILRRLLQDPNEKLLASEEFILGNIVSSQIPPAGPVARETVNVWLAGNVQ